MKNQELNNQVAFFLLRIFILPFLNLLLLSIFIDSMFITFKDSPSIYMKVSYSPSVTFLNYIRKGPLPWANLFPFLDILSRAKLN